LICKAKNSFTFDAYIIMKMLFIDIIIKQQSWIPPQIGRNFNVFIHNSFQPSLKINSWSQLTFKQRYSLAIPTIKISSLLLKLDQEKLFHLQHLFYHNYMELENS